MFKQSLTLIFLILIVLGVSFIDMHPRGNKILTNDTLTVQEIRSHIQKIKNVKFLIIDDQGFSLYKRNRDEERRFALAINAFANKYKDVDTYVMLAPGHIGALNMKYPTLGYDQEWAKSNIYSKLDKKITPIDIFPTIRQRLSEGLYFERDHHWNALAGHYAYVETAEAMDFVPKQLGDFSKHTLHEFVGSLYFLTGLPEMKKPEPLDYYTSETKFDVQGLVGEEMKPLRVTSLVNKELMGLKDSYSVFLGGGACSVLIATNTEIKTDRNLMIIRDSFGATISPFLAENFKTTIIVDPRFYTRSVEKMMMDHKITDVLFINNCNAVQYDHTFSKLFHDIL